MRNLQIIAVGKLKERYLTEGCAEYCKRLAAYGRIRITELEEV
ncbi:MAG: 23S rRNA (pseudouridine(1915)-N(3))-methyltransferase RlmH, partial [Oscillospiraceae bacterium]